MMISYRALREKKAWEKSIFDKFRILTLFLFFLNYSITLTSTVKNTGSLEHLTIVLVFLVYEQEIEIPKSHSI